MFCMYCGKELKDGARFCGHCGASIHGVQAQQPTKQAEPEISAPMPRKKGRGGLIAAIVAGAIVLSVSCGWLIASVGSRDTGVKNHGGILSVLAGDAKPKKDTAVSSGRPQLLNFTVEEAPAAVKPSVPSQMVSAGLSNVSNLDQFHLTAEEMDLLEKNMFVVRSGSYYDEFFERYESNRYVYTPNFVTVDSMMHTYHLYFSYLLNQTEKEYLAAALQELSIGMMEKSADQYSALQGTEWEFSARKNVAFFAIAAKLQNPNASIPDYVAGLVEPEMSKILAAEGIAQSHLTEDYMDYSQYKPRGYYEGDEVLERYFRAMMWYGQVNFSQENDCLRRSALLMTLAMSGAEFDAWERIYTITSVFAGVSDDLIYYEYAPAVEEAYGGLPAVGDLVGNEKAYKQFVALTEKMDPPAINSVPVEQKMEGDPREVKKGFRFLGQRFSIDAAIMQNLVYRQVEENKNGEQRLLPDTLDVAAALGSDLALELLEQTGAAEFANYTKNMEQLRNTMEAAPDYTWNTSLASSWLYTLKPILEVKGEGYPAFMTTEAWARKNLETFAGSYTELKHDTVLYAKQVMAEMGGGPPEEFDDRGYVEPEAEVYRRFALLAQQTADGLAAYGMITDKDVENLKRLQELAQQFEVISYKELRDELLSDEEYELIRAYGGTLEHFWIDTLKDRDSVAGGVAVNQSPSSLVVDIATDPNGVVLEVGNGRPAEILVIVPVDGELKLASGVVFDFYQFTQPISNRLTDTQWRQMIGQWAGDDGKRSTEKKPDKPWWTEDYWTKE